MICIEPNKIYYVYCFYDLDTFDVFYIGSGTGLRCATTGQKKRNAKFTKYYKNHNCSVNILKCQLTQDEALKYEAELIKYYKSIGQCSCNITLNGKPGAACGEDNPNYGNGNALRKTYKEHPELKDKTKHIGGNNGRACPIRMYEGSKLVGDFDCMKNCAEFLIDNKYINYRKDHICYLVSRISKSAKDGTEYYNFRFEFI